ncbi:ExbD/TolR family protein [Candidatus Sumerlaeota bacterium]
MELRRRQPKDSPIDVSAFADIAFLLIVFFILTTTFAKISGNKMEIPSGPADDSKTEQQQLTINLSPESILYGEDEQSLSIKQLRAALAREKFARKDPEQRMVILECGREVQYERYFQVVMAVADAGGVLALLDHDVAEDAKP